MEDILGYHKYSIDRRGWVYSWRQRRYLKAIEHESGYLKVALYSGRKRKFFLIHRLVAEAYIPNPNNYPCVNHKNSDRTDNRAINLEWCTHSQNAFHAIQSGKNKPGGRPKFICLEPQPRQFKSRVKSLKPKIVYPKWTKKVLMLDNTPIFTIFPKH